MVALNPATYGKDVAEVRSGGWLMYDSTLAARSAADAPRRHLSGHSAGRDVQRDVRGHARAHPDEEHRLCRRAGGAARHGPRRHPRAAEGEVRPQAGAGRLEPACRRPRLRLREGALRLPAADPSRAARQDQGRDPDRRQHRGGARLPLCRRHRRRLVSDHAGDLVDGGVQGLLPEVPARARHQPQPLRDPAGGRRDCRDRHGHRRVVGRRARLHADVRAGHLADERVHRPGVLRGSARR